MLYKKVQKACLDVLFPENIACCICNKDTVPDEKGLCPSCAENIRQFIPTDDVIINGLDGYRAGLIYEDGTALAMRRFKYYGAAYLAEFFACFMPIPPEWKLDVLVPVPLHKRRLRHRGYNQSLLIANCLKERSNVQVDTGIIARTRHTKRQARLGYDKRIKNLNGAFSALCDCSGMRIAIIDDVCTTGSTLTECAQTLKAAGAAAVYGITACRAEIK